MISASLAKADSQMRGLKYATFSQPSEAEEPSLTTPQGASSLISAPIYIGAERFGSLHALNVSGKPFSHPELLSTVARHVALSIYTERTVETHDTDRLTDKLITLDDIGLTSGSYEDLSETLSAIIEDVTGAGLSGVMIWDPDRQALQMIPGAFGAARAITSSYQIAASHPTANAARVFSTGVPYIANDSERDPGVLHDYAVAFGIKQLMTLRLTVGERLIGVLHLANKPTDFVIDDLPIAMALASRVAKAVNLATFVFDLRRQQRVEGVVSNVAVLIARGEQVHDFLSSALRSLLDLLEASWIAFVPTDSHPIATGTLELRGDVQNLILAEARETLGMRTSLMVPQEAGDSGHAAFHAPVFLGRRRIGTLSAVRLRGEPFEQYERGALTRLSDLIALAWATERYQQQRAVVARLHERQRIADDLHDRVAQLLYVAQISIDSLLEADGTSDSVASELTKVRSLLVRGDASIRSVIYDLSRRRTSGLVERLTTVVEMIEDEYSLPVHLQIDEDAADLDARLPTGAIEALVKVAQEALVNAAKHAGPCRVGLHLQTDARGRICMTVADDGIGASDGRLHPKYGLTSLRRVMHDQGGTIRVQRGKEGGLKVSAILPLSDPRPQHHATRS
jgi:signal transduction histidine kinase